MASMRDDALPARCGAFSAAACAAVCFLTSNDEEKWRFKRAIAGSLAPANAGRWRHSRPGRRTRWEGPWVKLGGMQWKDRMLAGELRDAEDAFLRAGMATVGRERLQLDHQEMPVDDFRQVEVPPQSARSAATIRPQAGTGISREGLLYDRMGHDSTLARLEVCLDCGAVVRWVSGSWNLSNPRYKDPMLQALAKISILRDFGCRPMATGRDWVAHIYREENSRADQLARERRDECRLLHAFPWPQHIRVKS